MTTRGDTTEPAMVVSVFRLHDAAAICADVAQRALHLDKAIRNELQALATNLDILADRGRIVERIKQGDRA